MAVGLTIAVTGARSLRYRHKAAKLTLNIDAPPMRTGAFARHEWVPTRRRCRCFLITL